MRDRYLITISEGWNKEQDKVEWCLEAYPDDDPDMSLGYVYSTNSISDAAYDLFNMLEREGE